MTAFLTFLLLFWAYCGGLCFVLCGRHQCRYWGLFCLACGPCGWIGYYLLQPYERTPACGIDQSCDQTYP